MSESIDKLGDSLSKIISTYSADVKKKAENELDRTADKILDYVKNNCPRGDSEIHLADTFIKTEVGEGASKTIYISSSTKGRLVHLVELGFKHVNGKHVAARPFLRPAMEEFTPTMLEDIKKIIEEG